MIPAEQIELVLPADGYVYDGSAKMPEIIIWLDSEKTVQVHRGSAYRKLNIHNAAEIARLLIMSGDPI